MQPVLKRLHSSHQRHGNPSQQGRVTRHNFSNVPGTVPSRNTLHSIIKAKPDGDHKTLEKDITPSPVPAVSGSTKSPGTQISGNFDVSLSIVFDEIKHENFWKQCKTCFPSIKWTPSHLLQAIGGSIVIVSASFLSLPSALNITGFSQSMDGVSGHAQYSAALHFGQEAGLLLAAAWVVFSLRARAPGTFVYSIEPKTLGAVVILSTALIPLADPLLYNTWSGAIQSVLGQPLPSSTLASQLLEAQARGDTGSLLLHGLATCIIGPVWEETFWRGFFLAALTKVLPLPLCVGTSSAMFAVLHLNAPSALPIFIVSTLCDTVYLRSASLAAPLCVHMMFNTYEVVCILAGIKDTFV